MYKLRLFVAVIFASVVAVSCEGTLADDKLDNLKEGFTLAVTGSSAEDVSVSVKVTNDDVVNYAVALISNESFKNTYESDLNVAAVAASAILVADYKVDFTLPDDKYIFSGDATIVLADSWEVTAGGSYVVLVYGVDAMGAQTTKVASKNIVTKAVSNWSEYADRMCLNEIAPDADWIEIYSVDREDVELDGFYVQNEKGDKTPLDGMVVESNSLFVFDCKVNANGDVITLFDSEGKVIDTIDVDEVSINASYGRKNDGAEDWVEFKEPSRGEPNGMAKYEGDAFKVTEVYSDATTMAVTIVPNEALIDDYAYAYITLPTAIFNDDAYYGGDVRALADSGAYTYQYWGVDFEYPDYKYVLYGDMTVNLVYDIWGLYENITEYTSVIYAVDAEGYRVSEPIRYDAVLEGTHTPTSESYKKWLGDWDATCTDSEGNPMKIEITIVPNIDDFSYYVAGFDISSQREYSSASAYLFEGVDDDGVEFSEFAIDANESLYFYDPEEGGQSGKLFNAAMCAISSYPGESILVSGSYYGFYGKMGESGETADLQGNEGEISTGDTFKVNYLHTSIFDFSGDKNEFYLIHNHEDYGGNEATTKRYPTSPYTLTKVEREPATPDAPADVKRRSSRTADALCNGSAVPNIYRSAMFKALNAPIQARTMKHLAK